MPSGALLEIFRRFTLVVGFKPILSLSNTTKRPSDFAGESVGKVWGWVAGCNLANLVLRSALHENTIDFGTCTSGLSHESKLIPPSSKIKKTRHPFVELRTFMNPSQPFLCFPQRARLTVHGGIKHLVNSH